MMRFGWKFCFNDVSVCFKSKTAKTELQIVKLQDREGFLFLKLFKHFKREAKNCEYFDVKTKSQELTAHL
jgi:hypothetical protein